MKDTSINMRVSYVEKKLLKQRAEMLGMGLTEYLLHCGLYSEDTTGILKNIVSVKEVELKESIEEFAKKV